MAQIMPLRSLDFLCWSGRRLNRSATSGTAVVVGVQPTGQDISVDGDSLLRDRAIMGSWHGAARARVDFLWILDLYRQGKVKLDELISRYRPLG